MKKTTILIASAVLFILSPAYADTEYKITLKSSKAIFWDNYQKRGSQYCTEREGGKFCIPESMVVSVQKKIEYNELQNIFSSPMTAEDREKLEYELEEWRSKGGRQTEIEFVSKIFSNCLRKTRNKYFRIWKSCKEEGSGDNCWITLSNEGNYSLTFENERRSCYKELETLTE